ncbi:MaoC-like dehydratase domain [Dillenia turbinata]|uniref:MaoC-like dehydratase domain n=1 Tax=Dillenia turbinata TaxID=194707 RepID=A0AAN8VRV2_9MAGN
MAESSRFDPDFFRISFQRCPSLFLWFLLSFVPWSLIRTDEITDIPLFVNRDAALYALGIGACAQNAMDMKELKYVYHENGRQFIQVLPTFAAVFPLGSTLEQLPGLMQFDPRLLLHGQQYMEIYKLLPSGGCVKNKTRIAGLHDKGKAAVIEVEILNYEENFSEPLTTVYFCGAGGFSESSHSYSYSAYPVKEAVKILKTQPFATFKDHTQQSQACNVNIALLYRLSGDYNLLHSDPKLAEVAGLDGHLYFVRFSRPILHGLCTLGFAVRVIHQTKVKERSRTVLSGHVDLKCLPSSL